MSKNEEGEKLEGNVVVINFSIWCLRYFPSAAAFYKDRRFTLNPAPVSSLDSIFSATKSWAVHPAAVWWYKRKAPIPSSTSHWLFSICPASYNNGSSSLFCYPLGRLFCRKHPSWTRFWWRGSDQSRPAAPSFHGYHYYQDGDGQHTFDNNTSVLINFIWI